MGSPLRGWRQLLRGVLTTATLSAALLAAAGTSAGGGGDPPVGDSNADVAVGPVNPPADSAERSPVLRAVLLLESLPQGGRAASVPPLVVAAAHAVVIREEARSLAAVRRPRCYVPLPQRMHYGMRGRDVEALQRALRKAGFLSGPASGYFGRSTLGALRRFQRSRGLPRSVIYGERTHKALDCFFGAKARSLMYERKRRLAEDRMRERIRSAGLYAYEQRSAIHYSQGIYRMRDFEPPPNVPNYTDCSGFATWLYKVARAGDPNCRGYDGFGYTGTQLQCGRAILLREIQVGDLVFYSGHVAIYIGRGRVVSHGSEAGPLILPVTYRTVYQVRTYL